VKDDEEIRFHNGDTLDSIPVVRPTVPLPPGLRRLPPDPEVFPSQPAPRVSPLVATIIAGAAVIGALSGMVVAWAPQDDAATAQPVPSASPSVTVHVQPEPTPPAPTATVTVRAEPTYTEEPDAAWESVWITVAPATGGDPTTDYCLAYDYDSVASVIPATLLANAPAWQCDDYLFSTHPSDMEGVWEETPPDCTATPGGRTVQVAFDPMTEWGGGTVLYSCLIAAD
jgi:hypothetical protein